MPRPNTVTCEDCMKKFATTSAMNMHKNAIHRPSPQSSRVGTVTVKKKQSFLWRLFKKIFGKA